MLCITHARVGRSARPAIASNPEDRGRKREAPGKQRERAAVLDRDLSGRIARAPEHDECACEQVIVPAVRGDGLGDGVRAFHVEC